MCGKPRFHLCLEANTDNMRSWLGIVRISLLIAMLGMLRDGGWCEVLRTANLVV